MNLFKVGVRFILYIGLWTVLSFVKVSLCSSFSGGRNRPLLSTFCQLFWSKRGYDQPLRNAIAALSRLPQNQSSETRVRPTDSGRTAHQSRTTSAKDHSAFARFKYEQTAFAFLPTSQPIYRKNRSLLQGRRGSGRAGQWKSYGQWALTRNKQSLPIMLVFVQQQCWPHKY